MRPIDVDLDIRAIGGSLKKGWWLIAICCTVFLVLAIGVASISSDRYRSEAVLVPVGSLDGAVGAGGMLRGLGGLAAVAGLSLDRAMVDPAIEAIEVIQSRQFLLDVTKKHGFLVPLLAADGWDRESGQLLINEDIYDVATGQWKVTWGERQLPEPTDTDIVENLQSRLSVRRDNRTGIVNIRIDAPSPRLAREWLAAIVSEANASLQQRDIRRLRKNLVSLRRKAETSEIAAVKEALYSVVQDQERQLAFAEARDDYALKYIDPPFEPDLRWWPRTHLLLILGLVLGVLAGVSVSIVRYYPSGRQGGPSLHT